MLAEGLSDPLALVVDDLAVYWLERDGRLLRVAKTGGAPETIGEPFQAPRALALNNTDLFIADGRGLWRVGKPRSDRQLMVAGETVTTLATHDVGLFWFDAAEQAIKRLGPTTLVPVVVAFADAPLVDLTAGPERVTWIEGSLTGAVRTVPRAGGVASTMAAALDGRALAASGDLVFWTETPSLSSQDEPPVPTGRVRRASVADEAVLTLAEGVGWPVDVVASDGVVYVLDSMAPGALLQIRLADSSRIDAGDGADGANSPGDGREGRLLARAGCGRPRHGAARGRTPDASRSARDVAFSTAFHNYGDVSAADASRLAALLVGQMRPAFSLLAPCDSGASAPEYATVIVKRGPEAVVRAVAVRCARGASEGAFVFVVFIMTKVFSSSSFFRPPARHSCAPACQSPERILLQLPAPAPPRLGLARRQPMRGRIWRSAAVVIGMSALSAPGAASVLTFHDASTFIASTHTLTTIGFDADADGNPVTHGTSLGSLYSRLGVFFPDENLADGLFARTASGTNGWNTNLTNGEGRLFDVRFSTAGITAVGVSHVWNAGAPNGSRLEAFDERANLIASVLGDADPTTLDFFGLTSTVPIAWLRVVSPDATAWGLDDLLFGQAQAGGFVAPSSAPQGVPEPTTLLLMTGALVACAGDARRRRQRREQAPGRSANHSTTHGPDTGAAGAVAQPRNVAGRG